jgi:hypothetical protein
MKHSTMLLSRTSEEGKSREIPWRTLEVPNPLERCRFAIRRFDSDFDKHDNRDDSYPTKWYGYLLHTLANRILEMEEIRRSGARDGNICDEEIEEDRAGGAKEQRLTYLGRNRPLENPRSNRPTARMSSLRALLRRLPTPCVSCASRSSS